MVNKYDMHAGDAEVGENENEERKERMRENKMLKSNPDIVQTVEQVHPQSSVEPVAVRQNIAPAFLS